VLKNYVGAMMWILAVILLAGCGSSATTTPVPPTEAAVLPTATPTEAPTAEPLPTATFAPEPDARADVRTYGGEYNDWGYDILLLDDGGTLIVGRANNTHLSHRIMPGRARAIRTDAEGNVIWEKDYGGEVDSMFYSPIKVGEEEYVVLGSIAASYDRDEDDMYLVKIDGEGNEIWSHTYGGRGLDTAGMVRQTADGGFILIGGRSDEFPTGDLYEGNIILIKTDAEGNEVWSQTYGDEILYVGWGVAQTPDGGYILTGWEAKTIPDRDVIVIKTDEAGNVEWSRSWDLDPGDRDGGFDLILTSDGDVVIACIQSMDSGPRGAVLIKVDLDGNEIWVKDLSEEGMGSEFWDIMEDSDGGYVMAGTRFPGQGSAADNDIRRGLIIKTNPDGEVLWQYVFDEEEYELAILSSAVVLPDGGYIFVGGAIRSGEEYSDMLWLKLTLDQKAEEAASAARYWPTDDWRSSTPEEQGMDSAKLEQMMAYIDEHDVEFDSVLVVRHGYIVLEEYFNGYDQHDKHHIQCVTKGFTSALIGIALDKGLIESVDQKMIDFFPDRTIANMDARKQQITLEHLLTMYDGLDWHEGDYPYTDKRNTLGQMWVSEDAVQYVLDRPMARDPGTEYFHNSGASILLGGILEQATGQDVYSFARKYLFDPIGIGDVQWERTTGNHRHTDGGLHMTPRDMARFGYLYLNHGTWDGQEIVSSEWVNRSTSTYHQGRYIGFGYHWFTFPGTGIYAAAGHYDQWIYVIPDADMVVVFTGQIADDDPHPANELLQDFILHSLH
jgi:CubicO group peptidase (beta-lactamase class C family)